MNAKQQSEETVDELEKLLFLLECPQKAIAMAQYYVSAVNPKQLHTATVDMVTINLNNGAIDFYKDGAADSYVIQMNTCTTIHGNAANCAEIQHENLQAYEHTTMVLCSDGIYSFGG